MDIRLTDLICDFVEDRGHLSHVIVREYWIENPALAAMLFSYLPSEKVQSAVAGGLTSNGKQSGPKRNLVCPLERRLSRRISALKRHIRIRIRRLLVCRGILDHNMIECYGVGNI